MFPAVQASRKSGQEIFSIAGRPTGDKLIDFWRWYASDLLSNALRGTLAEFIVARALGQADDVRLEWDLCDLRNCEGIRVEVKSAAYIQSWEQRAPSKILFRIRPTKGWDARTNEYHDSAKRRSDVYVFCVLSHADQDTVNPLDLGQWDFYVLATSVLDRDAPQQKTITLSSLLTLNPIRTDYAGLAHVIHSVAPIR